MVCQIVRCLYFAMILLVYHDLSYWVPLLVLSGRPLVAALLLAQQTVDR